MINDRNLENQTAFTLDKLLRADLVDLCKQRQLPTDGLKKIQLIQRLLEWKSLNNNPSPMHDVSNARDVTFESPAHGADSPGQAALKKMANRGNGSLYISAMLLESESDNTGEIPYDKLTIGSLLGSGGFKDCFAGVYNNVPVAIGKLRVTNFREEDLIEMRHEIGVLKQLRHDNIVRFVGVCHNNRNLCIVTELCENGDLYEYMKKVPRPAFAQQISMMHDIAHGVAYLHSRRPNIIHRDLKSQNVLVSSTKRAKINDFGLARIVPKANSLLHTQCGTPNWQAPEMWSKNPSYTEKVDVYACGLIFWEILQWADEPFPFHDMAEKELYENVRDKGIRPSLSKLLRRFPSPLLVLIQEMWASDPLKRPSMNAVLDRLGEFLA